jgi:hypothetical protein
MNVSSVSRELAASGGAAVPAKPKIVDSRSTAFPTAAAFEMCRFLSLLALPVVKGMGTAAAGAAPGAGRDAEESRQPLVNAAQVLNTLAFTPSLDTVRRLWWLLADADAVDDFVRQDGFASRCHCTGTLCCGPAHRCCCCWWWRRVAQLLM